MINISERREKFSMALYQRIRNLRENAYRTQNDLAEVLGTTAQYYGKYEKGERELPFSRAIELADYCGVSLDYLSGRSNVRTGQSATGLQENEMKILTFSKRLPKGTWEKRSFCLNSLPNHSRRKYTDKDNERQAGYPVVRSVGHRYDSDCP